MKKKLKTNLPKHKKFIHKYAYFIGLAPVLAWCLPYFTTGNAMEMGDFSFFSQAYEAIKISVFEYRQFPWWNPWVSGGVPLYANPQIGVFSLQTLLTFLFGAPLALKISLAGFTLAGFSSMYYLLRKYFKVRKLNSILISYLWTFCSFFVAHLPNHYTFAWYLVAPIYIYLSLTVRSIRSSILLGVAFAVMALSQTHNPFIHILTVCGIILAGRLIRAKTSKLRLSILTSYSVVLITFVALAGHRILLTFENLHEFPRNVVDQSAPLLSSFMGFFAPYSQRNPINIINYPIPPVVPHGFHEVTGTIGVFGIFSIIVSVLFLVHRYTKDKKLFLKDSPHSYFALVGLLSGFICFLIALGRFSKLSLYGLIKLLPIISEMRVSTRWFIWADLAFLIFIGVTTLLMRKGSFSGFLITSLLLIGSVEMFSINMGYQAKILSVKPTTHSFNKKADFDQQSYYGSSIGDKNISKPYEEYNSMMYNTGVLYANDALVQIHLAHTPSPRCGIDKGCDYVLSNNARVLSWSPNKVVLKRTSDGPIELNTNRSSYMSINGQRQDNIKTAEPFEKFLIIDTSEIISIDYKPSFVETLRSVKSHEPISDYN